MEKENINIIVCMVALAISLLGVAMANNQINSMLNVWNNLPL